MWKGLDRLQEGEEKKSEGRTVRWRNEVGIERKELLKELNIMLEVMYLACSCSKSKLNHSIYTWPFTNLNPWEKKLHHA